ncbi:MAG: cobyrinate a,c-diamide synthase [Thiobacillus sp.]
MPRVFISAAHKSSGKTTLTLGLAAALTARGLAVQTFKKGPDYIDPLWHGMASGRRCYNLDFHMMTRDEIDARFAVASDTAQLSLIEGNKGLYDGLDLDGSNSNAALAKQLRAPVVLVIDARGMTRGVAPLIQGYQAFDPEVKIAGVILNQLGGSRHESKLRAVIEHYTAARVIGAVQFERQLQIAERHLGLVPANEADAARARIDKLAESVAAQVDLDALRAIADTAPGWTGAARVADAPVGVRPRIAIAQDAAFGFYYGEDLDQLARAVDLVPFDTLRDRVLPDVDGLIIGGGFPEMFMDALSDNAPLRADIRRRIEAGLPAYAECGGLMYLSRSLEYQGRRRDMVGVVPGDTRMHDRPVGRGYVRLQPTGEDRWNETAVIPAHEFHYSSLDNLPDDTRYAYRVLRGHGIDGSHDGYQVHNLLAGYAHRRGSGAQGWIEPFLNQVRSHKSGLGAQTQSIHSRGLS